MRSSDAAISPRSPVRPPLLLRAGPGLALLLLLSLAYNWPYLRGGFQADEYFFLNMMRQDPAPYSRWLGFWAVDDVPGLSNIWWSGGGKTGVFWRPLPSVILEGSVRLFGEHAFPLHLLSVVLHGIVAGAVFLLARRLTGRPLVALIAGVLFVSCEDHSMVIGWIAMLADIICVAAVALALLAHAQWLERRRPAALAVSLAALACALLSKEGAVVAPIAVVLMTLLVPLGREGESLAPGARSAWARAADLRRDALSWAPAFALLIAYLVIYKILGFGGLNSGPYIDPLSSPGAYAARLVTHMPLLWLGTLSPVPPSLAIFLPGTLPALAAAGAVAFGLWIAGLWPLRRSAVVRWAIALYILALLPPLSAEGSERGLYFPAIASSILLALLLAQIGPLARRLDPASPRPPALTRAVGWAVIPCVLVPGIILSPAASLYYQPSFEKLPRQVATAFPHVRERNPDHVVLLNTPGIFHLVYPPPIIEHHVRRPIDVRVLSSCNAVVGVERAGERAFVVRADRAGWLGNMFAAMFRSKSPLEAGKVYRKGFLTATLIETTPDGRDALAVRFDVDRSLDDPSLLFLQWDGEVFRPIDLAALPVGKTVTLADTSNIWASM